MHDHDDTECPYFWMWLLDGLPAPAIVAVLFIVVLVWAFKHA